MIGETREDIDRLVCDFALGLASPEEAVWIEQRIAEDDGIRAELLLVQERLRELDYAATPEPVPDLLWSGIAQRLREPTVVALEDHRTAAPDPRARETGYWRGFVTAALAASLLFAAATGAFFTLRQPPEPIVIAVLLDSEANPGAIVEALGTDRVRIVPLVDIPVPAGRALEVWTLQDPAAGPVSLGLLQEASEATLAGFDLPRPDAEQLYEITLEPVTGSPIGRPTGPVLFKGFAKIPR